ncbi:hypothetical protein BN6_23980 [Saccharothrix espanaensis DSM 44229]|uniref:Uncharacterized protein n=1 Tax=Saccharothrix espanaensis (strain ATCC 51144 / DSM 44229 / JCM 9112 / NBRC 15066 / NRRL 15764) TaxID=1179773 RepID=K0JYD3_SACES|nr:hypothetical protein BN6_23980 [Saccharothrix espanaensis DSM 44229]
MSARHPANDRQRAGVDLPAQRRNERGDEVTPRDLVARDLQRLPGVAVRVGERQPGERPDVTHRDELHGGVRRDQPDQRPLAEHAHPRPGVVLHEHHRPQHRRGQTEPAQVLLDAPLGAPVRDPGVPVGPADRGVDQAPDPGRRGGVGDRDAHRDLRHVRRGRGLHAEHPVRAGHRPVQRAAVPHVAGDQLRAGRRRLPRPGRAASRTSARTLREIARRAGIGTLYRHFPTREALLEALLRQRFELLRDQAEALAAAPPADALREWLTEFVTRSTTYRGLPESVPAALRDEGSDLHTACAAMRAAAGLLVRAQAAGAVAADVTAKEVQILASGLAWGSERTTIPVDRLLDLTVHGLRPAT